MRHGSELREVGEGVHAYLQRGSWGYSNAGLIVSRGQSLLVDTLYDLKLTSEMLQLMRRMVPGADRIGTVVNTHANGDHCWGNQLVSEAEIISSRAAAEEMMELSPAVMATLLRVAQGLERLPPRVREVLKRASRLGVPRLGALVDSADFLDACFGDFEFKGIRLTPPTRTFSGSLELAVGDKHVQLLELGPAHTRGDTVAVLKEERVVFTGDLLFVGSHPIVWEGPVENWIAACDALLALDVDVVVPGHGPVTDKSGVQQTKDYWLKVRAAAQRGHAAGATPEEVARELLADGLGELGEAHRLVVNVDTVYRQIRGDSRKPDPVSLFAKMSELEAEAGWRGPASCGRHP